MGVLVPDQWFEGTAQCKYVTSRLSVTHFTCNEFTLTDSFRVDLCMSDTIFGQKEYSRQCA